MNENNNPMRITLHVENPDPKVLAFLGSYLGGGAASVEGVTIPIPVESEVVMATPEGAPIILTTGVAATGVQLPPHAHTPVAPLAETMGAVPPPVTRGEPLIKPSTLEAIGLIPQQPAETVGDPTAAQAFGGPDPQAVATPPTVEGDPTIGDLDNAGHPYDPTVHNPSKVKRTGNWKIRPRMKEKPEYQAYLTRVAAAPQQPVVAQQQPISLQPQVPQQPVVPGQQPVTYDALSKAIQSKLDDGSMTEDGYKNLCSSLGCNHLMDMMAHPNLLEQAWTLLNPVVQQQ